MWERLTVDIPQHSVLVTDNDSPIRTRVRDIVVRIAVRVGALTVVLGMFVLRRVVVIKGAGLRQILMMLIRKFIIGRWGR
jgi:hypothetical protein